MDFEALLKKYMSHVLQEEGVTFVEHLGNDPWPRSDVVFSVEEIAALKTIDSLVTSKGDEG